MITDLILSGMCVAGVAVAWRSLLFDDPSLLPFLRPAIERMPQRLSKMLLCGFCFTYWTSLVFVILFDPLEGSLPSTRFDLSEPMAWTMGLLFSWMSLAFCAVLFRFALVLIHESVEKRLK